MRLIGIKNITNITPAEMKDGQVGIIREWSSCEYIGRVVQCHYNTLVSLGMPGDYSFGNIKALDKPHLQIEILPPGTTLEI